MAVSPFKGTREEQLVCKLCGKEFLHLGSHIAHGHKITARAYKEEFGLPFNMPLISVGVYEKKKAYFDKHRERFLKNFAKAGTVHQFKKGDGGSRRVSEHERQRFVATIKKVNKKHEVMEACPVCKMQFNHMPSHLYNKHKMIQVI